MAETRVVKFWAVVGYIKMSALGQLTVPDSGGASVFAARGKRLCCRPHQ